MTVQELCIIQVHEFPKLEHLHCDEPLEENLTGSQYKCFKLENFKINVANEKDSYILTKTGEIVKCLNIINTSAYGIIIMGKIFNSVLPYFKKPANSAIFNIFLIKDMANTLNYWKLKDVKKKIMVILLSDELIAMPLIHTEC